MKRKILLTPSQKEKFDKLLKQAKFDRLATAIIKDKRYTAEKRAKMVVDLKRKIFNGK
jgi:hypothetical protein